MRLHRHSSIARCLEVWLGPNGLHSLFGMISNGNNSPGGRSNCLSSKGQYRSTIAIAFPLPNNDVLDWRSVFFCRTFNASLWNRSVDLAVVGCLDGDQVRKRTSRFEHGRTDTQSELLAIW